MNTLWPMIGNGVGCCLAVLALTVMILLWGVTVRVLHSYSPEQLWKMDTQLTSDPVAPQVTILKPLKGLDYELKENLQAFVDLQGPSYEVLLGVADPADPAMAVVAEVMTLYPQAPFRLILTEPCANRNPKMVNLQGLEPHIRGELVLISDANTRPHPDSLQRLVWGFRDPQVGYGCAPFFVRRSQTLGARLRALHIGSQLVSWIGGLYGLTGVAPIMGKWMVFRRQALQDVGGFAELSHYLAADGMTGQLLKPFGWKGVILPDLIDIAFGTWTVAEAWSQLLRWARLIRYLQPLGPLNLWLWNGTFWCLLGLGFWGLVGATLGGQALMITGLLAWALTSLAYWQRGGKLADLGLLPLLDLQQILVVPVAYGSNQIRWRDRQFQVEAGARILDPEPGSSLPQ